MKKVNDLVAVIRYCKVTQADAKQLKVEDVDDGVNFIIQGDDLSQSLRSASDFKKTQKVTQTRLAELVSTSYNTPLTVCFVKQDGTERELRGRLLSSEPLLGRSYYEDLDKPKNNRKRLVDHRTIKTVIVNNVKYEKK